MAENTVPNSGGGRRKHTLLVVDPHTYILPGITSILKDEFTIYTAASAQEAERVLEQQPIDILLTSQGLSGRTGNDLLECVRVRSPHTIRLLMTGFAEFDILLDAINRGHIFYLLQKPWKTDEFRMVLRHAAKKFDRATRDREYIRQLEDANAELQRRIQELEGRRSSTR